MSVSEIRPIAIEDELKAFISRLRHERNCISCITRCERRSKPVHRRVLFAMHELGQ